MLSDKFMTTLARHIYYDKNARWFEFFRDEIYLASREIVDMEEQLDLIKEKTQVLIRLYFEEKGGNSGILFSDLCVALSTEAVDPLNLYQRLLNLHTFYTPRKER